MALDAIKTLLNIEDDSQDTELNEYYSISENIIRKKYLQSPLTEDEVTSYVKFMTCHFYELRRTSPVASESTGSTSVTYNTSSNLLLKTHWGNLLLSLDADKGILKNMDKDKAWYRVIQ